MMQRTFILVSMAFMAMLLTAQLAPAQTRNCAPRDTVVERLASGYSESRQMLALNAQNGMLEVFASTDTGTWTITVTHAGGLTCIVAAGEHYQYVAEALPNLDEDA